VNKPVTRIVLAEDNEMDVELTMAALEEVGAGSEVTVVRDGEQLLDYLYRRGEFSDRGEGWPSVIMLDLKMPKVDGLEVLKIIKADQTLRPIPVVMLTSSREESDLIRSYQLGVNAYVVKPVDFKRFVDAVRSVGVFWGNINEPPPGSVRRDDRERA
jgi:CheY-like chemotaxis protein